MSLIVSEAMWGCIICGLPIFELSHVRYAGEIWLARYRIIYSNASGVTVSGVGIHGHNDPDDGVPADYREGFHNFELHLKDHITVKEHLDIGILPYGSVMHDACGRLLCEKFELTDWQLRRLFDICRTLSEGDGETIFWGHDYGGLMELRDHYGHNPTFSYDRMKLSQFLADPYNCEALQSLRGKMKMEYPPQPTYQNGLANRFSKLPWELMEQIAIDLPTTDVLSARLAIKDFIPIFYSKPFWASRFRHMGDRGFLCATQELERLTDWFGLYCLTKKSALSPGLRNRQRIWTILQELQPILDLQLSGSQLICPKQVVGLQDLHVCGCHRSGDCGCCFGFQHVVLPDDLTWIGFSVILIGPFTYITGIRLITEMGIIIDMGYVSYDATEFREFKGLKGVFVARSDFGIHAIRTVHTNMDQSKWIGRPERRVINGDMAEFESVTELTIAYDGFKLKQLHLFGKLDANRGWSFGELIL